MGCKAKYVPIRANGFLKIIYPHHAARVNMPKGIIGTGRLLKPVGDARFR